ncbi:response regulator receiver domain protein [Leptospira broomii serovar Hurstbridge str. 5399]|uniref:Response regulator receiver domain protein n=1 Tax=Leptospira broomii serovar Hurstbridge str. 5399 TaxID=1049789 RepID=T0F7P5_9LEPT|nr:response regulator [Leptospira broomii]EQA43522.1 response regulator receiver domain protein [Leptospira broomii serovar Hurstbridge str. 5399]
MKNQMRILLVEDELLTAMLIERELKKAGFIIFEHVTTGEKALTSADRNPPDLVLMDIMLAGGLDGIETASRLRSRVDVPIIFITGYTDLSIRARAEKISPLAYLVKPIEMNNLKAIIASCSS